MGEFNIAVSDVRPEHLQEIQAIEEVSFSMPWTRASLEHQMTAQNCVFLAALNNSGTVLGYVGLMFVLDEGYISNVAVAPEYRRQGVADKLISALIKREKDTLAFLTLEVRESNLPAISLYAKHGFVEVGKRRNYYDRPKENALLMTLFFDGKETKACI